jgi:hypothetical protein
MTQRRKATITKVAKEYQAAVDYIELVSPGWQEVMGLDHIEIKHHYLDAGSALLFGSGAKSAPGTVRCAYMGGTTFTAFVETRWNYQMADVYWMGPSICLWDEERLQATVVHEYSHILVAAEQYLLEVKIEEIAADQALTTTDLDALASLYYERMEMATENVARAILRASGVK